MKNISLLHFNFFYIINGSTNVQSHVELRNRNGALDLFQVTNKNMHMSSLDDILNLLHSGHFFCSKLTIETLEQGVKYVQS